MMTTNGHRIIPATLMLMMILIGSVLLAACDSNQPAQGGQTQVTTIPAGNQVIPATKVPPTPTDVPTPTIPVLLVPIAHATGEAFGNGEPASLNNIQSTLSAYQTALATTKAGAGASGNPGGSTTTKSGGSTTNPASKVSTPTPTRKVAVAPTKVASTSGPPAQRPAGNWVYDVNNWHVSDSIGDAFVDGYSSPTANYLIVHLIVKNNGQSGRSFSAVGLQLQVDGDSVVTTNAASDSVVQEYLKANNLQSSSASVFATMASGETKILISAFPLPANISSIQQLVVMSNAPKGLAVPAVPSFQ